MKTSQIASITLLAATVVLGGTSAAQAKKPKVAVLGLEVSDDGGGIDAQIAQFATELTAALRKRAKDKSSPYRLAPNSNKDLLEMKLLSGCANEARGCMTGIGKELKADRLIYGNVQRRKKGYQVTLKLLNVSSKKLERSTTDVIGFKEAKDVDTWSRRLFNRLAGLADEGTLMVKANVDSGTVYVNGEQRAELTGGTAQIIGLPEGKHEVRVESGGSAAFSTDVVIEAGHTAELMVNLAPLDIKSPSGDTGDTDRPGGTSRILFWTTAAITVGSAVGYTVAWRKVRGLEDETEDAIEAHQTMSGMQLDQTDPCGDPNAPASVTDLCSEGKLMSNLTYIFGIAGGVSAVAAGYFYYKGYIAAGKSKNVETAGRNRKSSTPTVQITPVVSPNYAGAGVKIEF